MDLKELQTKELSILNACLSVFSKYGLRYFMLGGTLLGAIRHKGFIPWDDDIDIGMPRPDYEKFISIIENELPENMGLLYFKNNPEFNNYFIKIIDKNTEIVREDKIEKEQKTYLWIDIFPIDGMPNQPLMSVVHKFSLLFSRLMYQYSRFNTGVNIRKKRSFFERLLISFGYGFTKVIHLDTNKQLIKLDKKLKKYPYDTSRYVVNFMGAYKFKEMFPRSYYDNLVEYVFENTKLFGSVEYDKILTQMYGQYMIPPKDSQRFSHSLKF